MSIWLGNQRLDSGIAHNIGDIFYTTRNGTSLNGAVECNGGTYDTRDYTGAGSIGELLASGKLDYISLSAYATAISTKGYCDKIGWDGTGTTSFRVPKLAPRRYVVKEQKPTEENNYTWYRLYNDGWVEQGGRVGPYSHTFNGSYSTSYSPTTVSFPIEMQDTRFYKTATSMHASVFASIYDQTTTDAKIGLGSVNVALSGIYATWEVIGQSAIVSDPTERAMFQLFGSTTDEAVATVGTVVAQVGALNTRTDGMIDYVVEKQEPTAGNGYTWYRKYKSGWVEQGGFTVAATTGETRTFTYMIPLSSVGYAHASLSYPTTVTGAAYYQHISPMEVTNTYLKLNTANGWKNTWYVCGKSKQN